MIRKCILPRQLVWLVDWDAFITHRDLREKKLNKIVFTGSG